MTPGSSIAHYRIVSKLGEGGMGAVYRATDTKLNRDVALKVLPDAFARDPERLVRFTREAQLLASLNHPNIAAIYGVEDRAIVLELVEGRALQGPLTEAEALPLINQLIDALEYAHEKSVIHRDLKPANILVSTEGKLKVLDFGLAKALAVERVQLDPANSPTLTMGASMEGVIMGTAGYMSPEQARGAKVDKRADIWAFGVVVYELLSGKRLFDGETVSDALASVLKHEPDYAVIPKRFHRLLQLCLMRDPQQRLRDISGARYLLEEVAATQERKPTRWTMAVVAASILIAAAASFIAWKASRPIDRPLMRLSVDLGPQAESDARTVVALSPDGRRIVFSAHTPDRRRILATRLLDQNNVELIRGTEGGTDPFFSPNGDWLGFFSEQTLKKVPIAGGAPVALAPASQGARGGTWGDDDSIVFAGSAFAALSRVAASGGPVQALTDLAANGHKTHRWPQFLPGSQAVLFTANTTTGAFNNEGGIAIYVPSKRETRILLNGGYFGRYVPSGHIIFVRESSLFAVRFDMSTLEVRGQPVAILEDVGANRISASGRFAFNRGGNPSLFSYLPGRPEELAPILISIPRNGTAVSEKTNAPDTRGALSPDGKRYAYFSDVGGKPVMSVWDFSREVSTQLASNVGTRSWPIWTPDGRHIVYSNITQRELWWVRADGAGTPVKLVDSVDGITAGSLTPDGRRLAFDIWSTADGSGTIATTGLDLSNPEKPKSGKIEKFLKTDTRQHAPQFSHDGRWLAYVTYESGLAEVEVRPFPGPGGRWKISTGGGVTPRWAHNGKELLFADLEGNIMTAFYETKGDVFIAAKPKAWGGVRLRQIRPEVNFDISPDGQRVIAGNFPTAAIEGSLHMTLLVNFADELRRRLP